MVLTTFFYFIVLFVPFMVYLVTVIFLAVFSLCIIGLYGVALSAALQHRLSIMFTLSGYYGFAHGFVSCSLPTPALSSLASALSLLSYYCPLRAAHGVPRSSWQCFHYDLAALKGSTGVFSQSVGTRIGHTGVPYVSDLSAEV